MGFRVKMFNDYFSHGPPPMYFVHGSDQMIHQIEGGRGGIRNKFLDWTIRNGLRNQLWGWEGGGGVAIIKCKKGVRKNHQVNQSCPKTLTKPNGKCSRQKIISFHQYSGRSTNDIV
jgi:hypothetical protein